MLMNEERALLHVATVLVRGGHIDQYQVSEDGVVVGPRTQFQINASSDDDVALVSMIYAVANLIKLGGVDPVDAVDHLIDLGVRHRFAKNVVNRVVGRRHGKDFLLVWDVVRPLYGLTVATPTADLGDT